MKSIFFLFLSIAAAAFNHTYAQLFVPPAAKSDASSFRTTTGKAMSDLAHALKTDTYLKTAVKDKPVLFEKMSAITTAPEAGAALVSLIKTIKPGKFKSGFSTTAFATKTASISTMKQANEMLISLESALIPDAFAAIWKLQRAGWLNEVKR